MNKEEITERIRLIEKELAKPFRDNENAHIKEDELLWDFVKFIANGGYNIKDIEEMAAELLKLQELDYERWYS